MGCCARPLPGNPAGVALVAHLPGVTSISAGPSAGTLADVNLFNTSMHGVAEMDFDALFVAQPVSDANNSNVEIRMPSDGKTFCFIFFEQKSTERTKKQF